jgi:hypothetical protein
MADDRDTAISGTNAPGQPAPAIGPLALVRFTAELGMLAALGYGGWHLVESVALSAVMALVLPVAAATVWGRWIAPRAAHRLTDPAKLAVEVVLFAVAAGVLVLAGPQPLTTLLAVGLLLSFLLSLPHRRTELPGR